MKDSLQKVDLKNDPMLSSTHLINMKRVEEMNLRRVERLNVMRKKNRFTAIGLGIFVAAVYVYTIKTVKQEEFLDDFDEPAKISE